MRIILISLLLLLNIGLEATLFDHFRIFGIKPDFTLMIVISVGILRGKNYGTYVGLAAGLLLDVMFGKAFGINGMAYMISGLIAGYFNEKIFKDSILPAILFNIAAVAICQTIIYMFSYLTNSLGYFGMAPIEFLASRLVPLMIYNGVLGGFIYRFIYLFDKSAIANRRLY